MLELVNTESTNISSSDISKYLWFGEIQPVSSSSEFAIKTLRAEGICTQFCFLHFK